MIEQSIPVTDDASIHAIEEPTPTPQAAHAFFFSDYPIDPPLITGRWQHPVSIGPSPPAPASASSSSAKTQREDSSLVSTPSTFAREAQHAAMEPPPAPLQPQQQQPPLPSPPSPELLARVDDDVKEYLLYRG